MDLLKRYIIVIPLIFLTSCFEDQFKDNVRPDDNVTLDGIDIPEGFDYSTHKEVKIKIQDYSTAIYDVFVASNQQYFYGTETFEDETGQIVTEDVYKDDIINKKVFSGVASNGAIEHTITLPLYTSQVYIRRDDNLKFSGELVNVINNEINYSYQESSQRNATITNKSTLLDFFYCVNGQGDLFQVNPSDGNNTLISQMPMGSWTVAVDQENLLLYSVGRSSPFPLMRFDIQTEVWTTIANLNVGGTRLDFNANDNLLYFGRHDYLMSVDPNTGETLENWVINGLHDTSGGDIVFADDGTLYLTTFSGLYRCVFNGISYDAIRITSENIPFTPSSITIDSAGNLWLADNELNGNLIIVDPLTGNWQYVWGANAGNNSDFGRIINDLAVITVNKYTPNTSVTDTDGDGVVDAEDAFPTDPNMAFILYSPNDSSYGTIAFEDLWPSYGDYDFNDVALNYQTIAYLNADNLVVQIDLNCHVKAHGAAFINAIGIELEGLSSSQVRKVEGTVYTENYISLNPNGTEANQNKAVIILTDNAVNFTNEHVVKITLEEPISTDVLGTSPFNPFIIHRKIRKQEVHLPYKNPTSLAFDLGITSGHFTDPNINYLSETGYPWAISIINNFDAPKERVKIYDAYNFFIEWAASGGQQYNDWYKDKPGYRNNSLIQD